MILFNGMQSYRVVIGGHRHWTDNLLFDTKRANTILQGVRLSIVLSKCLWTLQGLGIKLPAADEFNSMLRCISYHPDLRGYPYLDEMQGFASLVLDRAD
jgi:hypothetical protein